MKLKETLTELKSMPAEVACCSLSMIAVIIFLCIGIITTKVSVIMICVVSALYMIIILYRACNSINEIGGHIQKMQKICQKINP